MIVVAKEEVAEILSMDACIEIMETVFMDLARGDAVQTLRSVTPIAGGNALGLMPAYLKQAGVVGAKMITIFPENYRRQIPSHQGLVALFDAANGMLMAIVNGQEITAIRTAAASAVATNVLARPDAQHLAILGTGEQARTHLTAMLCVRPIQQVNVWSLHPENARRFQADMSQSVDLPIEICDSVQDAVANADIICTVTAAREPILKGDWVKSGTHVNAVGACRANDRELDTTLVKIARFFADRVESAAHEAGDYLLPLAEGAIKRDHLIGELGDLLMQTIKGRTSKDDITIFKSLGLAIEDLAAVNFIYQEAKRLHKGTHIRF
jgi:alanine dehydrogenase